jgi:hypothetical protein
MIIAALVTFAILLVAWLVAPDDAPVAARPIPSPLPVEEPVAEAA